jgi:ADP-heptose:LPS heptosyltransferase
MTRERPALTSVCEEALLRVLRLDSVPESRPLETPPRRLLAVKVHGMGDSVMVRSLLEYYRRRHPEVEIGVMAGRATREVLTLGFDFAVHGYDQQTLNAAAIVRTWNEVRKRRYDAVLNFEQGSLAGTAFLRATGIPARVGFVPLVGSAKQPLLTHALPFREGDSMWRSFMRLMQVVDPEFPEAVTTLPLPVTDETRNRIGNWIASNLIASDAPLIALHMGSAQKRSYRRWPVAQFVGLGERLRASIPNLVVALTGQQFERPLISEFMAAYSGLAFDSTELHSIAEAAALLERCQCLISNDTGIMHLGAAMGTPTVGIFGPESPQRWAPAGPRSISVRAAGVACSPCANTYSLQDPRDCVNPNRLQCLREVSIEMVFDALREVIGKDLSSTATNRFRNRDLTSDLLTPVAKAG